MKIIDIGAGSCEWNKDRLPVFGIDCNEQLLSYGKSQGRLIDYKAADIFSHKFADKAFSIAVATEILEHIDDVDAAIKEVYRILDDEGLFIISVPDDRGLTLWKILFFIQTCYRGYIRKDLYYRMKCGHLQHFSLGSLSNLLKRHGFEIDIIFSVWKCSIFTVARKGRKSIQKSINALTVVMPVKNEANNIGDVINKLLQSYPNLNIIVGDDGSTDGTVDIIKDIRQNNKNVVLLDRRDERIKGLTVSILDAIAMVKTKYFMVMDSDGQHKSKYVERLYNQLKLNSNLSVASRVSVPGWRWDRKLISRIGNFLGKSVLFLKRRKAPADILSGFFAVETDYWRRIVKNRIDCFSLKGYKLLFDFLKICDSSINLENVYYIFNTRGSGSSKINLKIYLEYLRALLR
jgi:dolichol-phosphate mannosyltransferase